MPDPPGTEWLNQQTGLNALEAVERAIAAGLDKWPSYETVDEAETRYEQIHRFMDAPPVR